MSRTSEETEPEAITLKHQWRAVPYDGRYRIDAFVTSSEASFGVGVLVCEHLTRAEADHIVALHNASLADRLRDAPEAWKPEELRAISLCVGWCLALSLDSSPDAQHRHPYAMRAMDAFRRVFGEQFHTTIRNSLPTPPSDSGT